MITAEAGLPAAGFPDGLDHPQVADAAAAVDRRVGVDHLAPAASAGQADPVAEVRFAGEVGNAGDLARPATAGRAGALAAVRAAIPGIPGEAEERQHVARRVVGVYPAEAVRRGVLPPERRAARVEPVEVGDQPLNAGVPLAA